MTENVSSVNSFRKNVAVDIPTIISLFLAFLVNVRRTLFASAPDVLLLSHLSEQLGDSLILLEMENVLFDTIQA